MEKVWEGGSELPTWSPWPIQLVHGLCFWPGPLLGAPHLALACEAGRGQVGPGFLPFGP